MEANSNFPETNLQSGYFFGFGTYNHNNSSEWIYRLNKPKTGIMAGITHFGNTEKIGLAYSIVPFTEFSLNKSRTFFVQLGMGASYFNTIYDSVYNPLNKGIATKINWSFKSLLFYQLKETNQIKYKIGVGYFHHSNGHTRLPNQGLNSFLVSVAAEIKTNPNKTSKESNVPHHQRSTYNFIKTRFGLGQNALSEYFNTKKEVYNFSFSYGKVINKTYKLEVGAYYRVYEHYYDYIRNEEQLITEEYQHFIKNPFGYASNVGVFGSGELLLGHVGMEFQLGLNIYKPFYPIDYKLNGGYDYEYETPEGTQIAVVLGELDWYYEIKKSISARMGLNYYFINTNKTPQHNFFLGAHINANLGQADFSELSAGYVYSFHYKQKNR
ncbi:Lipid A 3-O-deacylase (PagL) [Pustulibacterium marinum]|uniref:Lipid A 3-O-deacylase (PagL) n=1 Tax=Pustulibacterium marinum TaxID=1224947 RepID=A0A1I7FAJ3_9FLAO|nr:acyloxyacyl hydrolase [Pustulibacterium marinum]SFU33167.1 Lipid A 3-O-deacylase (PagL) [Pustulibacterium marinum]